MCGETLTVPLPHLLCMLLAPPASSPPRAVCPAGWLLLLLGRRLGNLLEDGIIQLLVNLIELGLGGVNDLVAVLLLDLVELRHGEEQEHDCGWGAHGSQGEHMAQVICCVGELGPVPGQISPVLSPTCVHEGE